MEPITDEKHVLPTINKHPYVETYPWARFTARLVDSSLILVVVVLLEGFYRLQMGDFNLHSIWIKVGCVLLWFPIEVLLMTHWGYTPGKFLLGIQVTPEDGSRLTLNQSFKRALLVKTVGECLCFSILNSIANLFAYAELTEHRKTYWDRKLNLKVHHKVTHSGLVLLAFIGACVIIGSTDLISQRVTDLILYVPKM